jgi:hypothetical protein
MNEGPAQIVRLCHGALHRIFGFVVGVGVWVGYGIREVISRRRHDRARHHVNGNQRSGSLPRPWASGCVPTAAASTFFRFLRLANKRVTLSPPAKANTRSFLSAEASLERRRCYSVHRFCRSAGII